MKAVFTKIAVSVCLIVGLSLLAAAGPATLDTLALLSAGPMNEFIGALVNRTDAESYNLRSRAYYATEQWDDAILNAERAVSLRGDDSQFHLWLGRAYGQKAAEIGNPLSAASLARKAKNE